MQIIKSRDLEFIPASHEDQVEPQVFKKVLFKKEALAVGRLQMINWAKLPPGNTFKAHYHEDMDEIFILTSGRAEVEANGKKVAMEKGDAVLVEKNEVHTMANTGMEDVLYIVIGISRGMGGKTIVTKN